MLTMARETSDSLRRAARDETEVRGASSLLDAVTLWSRQDLDRHLGTRQQGPWLMHVDRDDHFIYRISLWDSAGRHELLETALYRPEQIETVVRPLSIR